ncbi:MAG: DUF1624 domain-containing protein [Acidobacteria bacterium]|nr:DUF1624 domain-containing protein [Acidobacteriota bacterium]
MKRINSIDIVRGVVMIIMALDHVRDLIHVDSIAQSPTNLATTTPFLFFTRWITHLCAPTFVFLAGTSAYLALKDADAATGRSFLIKRGLWLILLEFTLVTFALWFDPGFHTLIFQVIAAIGFGFIALGLLRGLGPKTLGILGLIIVFGHNLTALIPFAEDSIARTVLTPFFGPAAFPLGAGRTFVMGYSPIPWLGVMLVGYAAGKLFELDPAARRRRLLALGGGALALFVVLRLVNVYGDPVPWAPQADAVYTFLSFMNVTKYAPSLLFCLVTLGVMFLMLAAAEGAKNRATDVAEIYGRVPLFYFLAHLYLIHLILLIVLFLQGFPASSLEFAGGTFGRPKDAVSGLPLWQIYALWVGVVAALYVPCRLYGEYKRRHREKTWLRYL